MRSHQQRLAQSEIQIGNNPQRNQKPNVSKKFSDDLRWLKDEIYDCISSSSKCAGEFICSGFKRTIQVALVIILIFGAIYIIWQYVLKNLVLTTVCPLIGSIPLISKPDYCTPKSKTNYDDTMLRTLSVNSVVEKTVTIAEELSETDVSVPIKITEVKISLIDLQTNVMFSQLEQTTKDQLLNGIDEAKSSATLAINQMHKMLASFNGALAKIEIYTSNLFKILTPKTGGTEIPSQFEMYLEHIESEIERIIHNADSAHSNLDDLGAKLDVLNEIASKSTSYQTAVKKLDDMQYDSVLAKIYQMTVGKGKIEKEKHQRNLNIFNKFPNVTKSASIKIQNVITRLQSYKHEIEEVKFTVSKMDRAQTLPVNIHVGILKSGLESIRNYKKYLNGRITGANTFKL